MLMLVLISPVKTSLYNYEDLVVTDLTSLPVTGSASSMNSLVAAGYNSYLLL